MIILKVDLRLVSAPVVWFRLVKYSSYIDIQDSQVFYSYNGSVLANKEYAG